MLGLRVRKERVGGESKVREQDEREQEKREHEEDSGRRQHRQNVWRRVSIILNLLCNIYSQFARF